MEKIKRRRWIITIMMSIFMLFTAFYSLSMKEAFVHLGFPDYFRIELNTLKILGALVLLVPQAPQRLREWVYAGFLIVLVSALTAHISSGDPAYKVVFPSLELILFVSGILYIDKLNSQLHKQTA